MRRWIPAVWLGIVFTFIYMAVCAPKALAGGGSWVETKYGWQFEMDGGGCPKEQWMLIDDRWYYFDRNGYAVTGWKKIHGEYYYFKETSCAMALGWYYDEDDGRYYYLERDGRHTGWLYQDGAWYWFNSSGKMADGGYTMARMHQYYFFRNGQMAANQYVGLKYYDENGNEDSEHSIVRVGDGAVKKSDRDAVTEALENVPREWIRDFVEQGWELMYYTDKSYFSAPDTEDGVYYVRHKLDTHYKKLKFTSPGALTRAFGEYVGYRLGLYDQEGDSPVAAMAAECENVSTYTPLPSYFDDKEEAQFGLVFETFIDPENQDEFMRDAPELYAALEKLIYPSGRPSRLPEETDIFAEDGEE